jgi:hypothetical protein
MKFTTFYFSGTGNTEWASKEFTKKVIGKGHQGELFPIEQITAQDTAFLEGILLKSEYIGFANPIYGANMPPIMRSFIEKICLIAGKRQEYLKPVYIINTFGYINAFGPFAAKKLFSNTKLEIISYVNINLCNNISTPKIKTKPLSAEELRNRKEKARVILDKMVCSLTQNKKYITGIGLYLIPGIVIRKKLQKGITDNYKSLSVKKNPAAYA